MPGAWAQLLLLGLRLQLSLGFIPVEEEDPVFWNQKAAEALHTAKKLQPIQTAAKNLIIFLGDGMGVPTVTATRILKGQLNGHLGPETSLAMDHFPYLALSKTYNVDRQVPDSAGTATAYLCGVKANYGTIGLSAAARYNQCNTTRGNEVMSVLSRAKKAGKSVGVVTTTRVQHASPAGTYAHTVNRNWYSDTDMPAEALNEGCQDIATQLISNTDIDVILGGGRKYMFPTGTPDPEYPDQSGVRADNRNLVQEWLDKHQGARYVWNRTALIQASQDTSVTHLMGLFEPADMKYDATRDTSQDPSLTDMTEAAIRLLSRNAQGFYLFVEGGRIDHGHHASNAYMALTEAVMFDIAIERAGQLTSEKDTLTLVTADHSHVFSFGGYTLRGSSILGLASSKASDGKAYTSILYGNGPGYALGTGSRPDVNESQSMLPDYKQQAAVPLSSETHGGEDVALFARGPQAHLVHGVQEQNFVAHVMAFAACLEPYTDCGLGPSASTTSAAPPAGTTSAAPPAGTTSAAPPARTTSAAPPARTTSAAPPARTTSAAPPARTTSAAPPARTTSAAPPARTTSAAPPARTTSAAPPDGTTSAAPPDGTTSAAPPARTTSAAPPAPWVPLPSFCSHTRGPRGPTSPGLRSPGCPSHHPLNPYLQILQPQAPILAATRASRWGGTKGCAEDQPG